MGFLTGGGAWARSRADIAIATGMDPDLLDRRGREWVSERRVAEGLSYDLPSPPAPRPAPLRARPVPPVVQLKKLLKPALHYNPFNAPPALLPPAGAASSTAYARRGGEVYPAGRAAGDEGEKAGQSRPLQSVQSVPAPCRMTAQMLGGPAAKA